MSSDNFSNGTKTPVIRAKVWVELDNRLIMSDYLATLLKNIDRTRSLKSAASAMKLPYRTALKKINEILWEIEDKIRGCERIKDFGDTFIKLARAVYVTNDKRMKVKRAINDLLGSQIIEEKSYTAY